MMNFTPLKDLDRDKLPRKLLSQPVVSELEKVLTRQVQSAVMDRDELLERWSDIDEFYFGPVPESLKRPWPDAPVYEYDTLRKGLDAVRAQVVNPVLRAEPIGIVRMGGPASDRNEKIEAVLTHALKIGKIDVWLRQAADIIGRRGQAHVKPRFVPAKSYRPCTVVTDVVDPANVIAYPNSVCDPEDLVVHGSKHVILKWEFEEHRRSGAFFSWVKTPSGTNSDATIGDRGRKFLSDNSDQESDRPVELYCLTVRFTQHVKDPNKRYRVWFCPETEQIVRIAPENAQAAPLLKLAYHLEPNTFFNELSRGYSLMGPQLFGQDMRAMFVWGAYSAASPATFTAGLEMHQQHMKVQPFHVYKLKNAAARIETLQSRMDLSAFPALINMADRDAESAARISQNSMGQVASRNMTATEAMEVAQGAAMGASEDAAYLGAGLAEYCQYLLRYVIAPNWDEWVASHGDALPSDVSADDLLLPYHIEVNGQTPAMAPHLMMQQALQFMQLLGPAAQEVITQHVASDPEMVIEFLRSAIESSSLQNKEKILKTPEEVANDGFAGTGSGAPSGIADILSGYSPLPEFTGMADGAEAPPFEAPSDSGGLAGY